MRIMLIGTDRTLFSAESALAKRLVRFGEYISGLDSIVFSTQAHHVSAVELAPSIHAYPASSRSRLLYGWDALRIARKLSRPDIVSAQDPFETGLTALLIARFFKVPFAVEIHTDFLEPAFTKSFVNRIRVFLAGFVLRRASGGYAVSKKVRDRVVEHYALTAPFEVLPIYVDTSSFAALSHIPHPRFKTALLWVGRLEKEKCPEQALIALAKVRRAGHTEVGLMVVGSGRLTLALKETARVLGISSWVEFIGAVQDVQPYYAQADLLLVTSSYEGYGMVIIEALAARVPVLSTEVGIAREAGAIIAEGSYADALLTWLQSPRPRGTLKLETYENEAAYFMAVKTYYASLVLLPETQI